MQKLFHPGQVEQTKWQSASGAGNGGNVMSGCFCTLCGAWKGELGNEPEPELYVSHLVQIFEEVRRVLRKDGTLWLNLGSSYAGSGQGPTGHNGIGKQEVRQGYKRGQNKMQLENFKPKDLIPIPWMAAIALQKAGWWLRGDCIWYKPACMPASYKDRPTTAHEYILLLSKSQHYYYDCEGVKEDAIGQTKRKNRRSVWIINPRPFKGAHFACFPPELPLVALTAGASTRGTCSNCGAPFHRIVEKSKCTETNPRSFSKVGNEDRNDAGRIYEEFETVTVGWKQSCECVNIEVVPSVILDPFGGSGTTAMIAKHLGMDYVICELNPEYVKLAEERIAGGYKKKHITRKIPINKKEQLEFTF